MPPPAIGYRLSKKFCARKPDTGSFAVAFAGLLFLESAFVRAGLQYRLLWYLQTSVAGVTGVEAPSSPILQERIYENELKLSGNIDTDKVLSFITSTNVGFLPSTVVVLELPNIQASRSRVQILNWVRNQQMFLNEHNGLQIIR